VSGSRLAEQAYEQASVPEVVAADAQFVLIGAHPRTDWLPREIASDVRGFLLTGEEFPDGCNWPVER
jgi:thioredoxin reductase (NADPH)